MIKTTEKHYLARIDFDERISREDKLFGCLLFCGYPANRAYQIAYPTKADANSSIAMAHILRKLAKLITDKPNNGNNNRPNNDNHRANNTNTNNMNPRNINLTQVCIA